MNALTAVFIGSALGGMARFWLAELVSRRLGRRFPWGTLAVNASGALAIGVAAGLLLPETEPGISDRFAWQVIGPGFLGSYTTVSSFSLETLALAHAKDWPGVAGNIVLSLVLCLAAAGAGFALAGAIS
jgi:fluoride exporter